MTFCFTIVFNRTVVVLMVYYFIALFSCFVLCFLMSRAALGQPFLAGRGT